MNPDSSSKTCGDIEPGEIMDLVHSVKKADDVADSSNKSSGLPTDSIGDVNKQASQKNKENTGGAAKSTITFKPEHTSGITSTKSSLTDSSVTGPSRPSPSGTATHHNLASAISAGPSAVVTSRPIKEIADNTSTLPQKIPYPSRHGPNPQKGSGQERFQKLLKGGINPEPTKGGEDLFQALERRRLARDGRLTVSPPARVPQGASHYSPERGTSYHTRDNVGSQAPRGRAITMPKQEYSATSSDGRDRGGDTTQVMHPTPTSLLSYACQKRRFNPSFIEWKTNGGKFMCSVDLDGQIVQNHTQYDSAFDAKQASAELALRFVRKKSIPIETAEYREKKQFYRMKNELQSSGRYWDDNSNTYRGSHRIGNRDNNQNHPRHYNQHNTNDNRRSWNDHNVASTGQVIRIKNEPKEEAKANDAKDKPVGAPATAAAVTAPGAVAAVNTAPIITRAATVAPGVSGQSTNVFVPERIEEQRRLITCIQTLYGQSSTPSSEILSNPLASQAFLQGFALGGRTAQRDASPPGADAQQGASSILGGDQGQGTSSNRPCETQSAHATYGTPTRQRASTVIPQQTYHSWAQREMSPALNIGTNYRQRSPAYRRSGTASAYGGGLRYGGYSDYYSVSNARQDDQDPYGDFYKYLDEGS
ncbi:hypothetical protein F4778DRAFT_100988 [Xylariomycetidae sp. FL2044]|nr:hypothetical protein F4778DRAFT_100988 [Xylariomycetidae sp. FL2044]